MVFIKATIISVGAYSEIDMMSVLNSPVIEIGNETAILEQAIIGGLISRKSRISVGDHCTIFKFSFLNPTLPIEIGNDVGIGGSNYLFTHGTWSRNYVWMSSERKSNSLVEKSLNISHLRWLYGVQFLS